MSEPKLISPLLDGFSLGAPISDHDGVCCSPAVKENSENKYIVKVISIPASQTQLDALLLTGAYKDPTSAMDYFKELTEGVLAEAECLKKLSKLEGFLPYDSWQVVPMERNRLGYDVYLVGQYKYSLERYMRRNTVSHLSAVNLGLDMCAALAIARRAGWIYVDLKPSNIFLADNREYRIGDLGFMKLDSLKFSSLPRKYCSRYSAPEAQDVMRTLNDTVDTYSVGMLLYQIYNNGQLPDEHHPPEEPLPAPANADYEMAEIILKACAPLPKDRWADPVEMGQALVAYMQRNSVNDIPIVPPTADSFVQDSLADVKDQTLPGEQDAAQLTQEELSEEMSTMVTQADDLISHETPAPVIVPEPTSIEELHNMLDQPPEERPAAEMEPLIQPEELPQEEQVIPENAEPEPAPAEEADKVVNLDDHRKKKRRKRSAGTFLALILLLGALFGGLWFYRNEYLIIISSLEVEPGDSRISVILDTQAEDSLLSIVCTDIYGNSTTQPVSGGKAEFTDLIPDMLYKIRVEVTGFHCLDGSVTHEYMTPAQTNIANLSAVSGPNDGSVVLSFSTSGLENDEWIVKYSAEGEAERSQAFTGTSVALGDLTVGSTYLFRLESESGILVAGQTSVEFTAVKLIIAENLRISAGADNTLTVSWDVPADTEPTGWTVHCYSSDGYDSTLNVTEATATFEGISTGSAYTVEVLADGMTQPARTNVTADPASIVSITVDDSDPEKLTVSWEYEGSAPDTGWILLYSIDAGKRQEVVKTEGTSVEIGLRIPGADYQMTIQAADGSSVFNNTCSYTCPNAEIYENSEAYFYADTLEAHLLATPQRQNWSYKNVSRSDYRTEFASGEGISLLLYHPAKFFVRRADSNISLLYVIRDSEGNVMTDLLSSGQESWRSLWDGTDYRYCELDIPAVPTAAGDYTLYLYFNGYAVTSIEFTVTE